MRLDYPLPNITEISPPELAGWIRLYMQGSHSVISHKGSLHTTKTHIRTIKTLKAWFTNKNICACLFELKR